MRQPMGAAMAAGSKAGKRCSGSRIPLLRRVDRCAVLSETKPPANAPAAIPRMEATDVLPVAPRLRR